MATTPKKHDQRQAELPVVAEAVSRRGLMTIRLGRAVATGRSGTRPRPATVTHISTGLAETSMSPAAETATGITISAVAMLLISCPRRGNREQEEPEQQRHAARSRRRC